MKTEKRRRSWFWDVGVPVLLVLLALLPRVVAFGAMGNPDEVGWRIKSVAFYDGLARGDWLLPGPASVMLGERDRRVVGNEPVWETGRPPWGASAPVTFPTGFRTDL